MKSRGFSESHSIPYGKVRILGFLEAPTKERAATAERTNAQPRNRGLRQFLVCGVDKVKSIALMHGLTHNMVCGWRLIAI